MEDPLVSVIDHFHLVGPFGCKILNDDDMLDYHFRYAAIAQGCDEFRSCGCMIFPCREASGFSNVVQKCSGFDQVPVQDDSAGFEAVRQEDGDKGHLQGMIYDIGKHRHSADQGKAFFPCR